MFNNQRSQSAGSKSEFFRAVSGAQVENAVAAESVDVRARFVSAVYGLLTISIISAIAGAWLSAATGVKTWVFQNWLLMLILYIGAVIGVYALRHKKPINMLMLYGFTFITGLWIGPVAYMFPGATLNAGITTAVIFTGLTIYARTTKRDFSFMRGFLTTGLIAIIVMILLNMFFFQSSALSFGISVAGVLIFSGFILYDTQMIMRRYPTNEYISATLSLYLDILNLFWFLLNIFISLSSNE